MTLRSEPPKLLRVVVADDSALARELIAGVINEDPAMLVAGVASGGNETIHMAEALRPDLITMDLVMPDLDGVEVTRVIMSQSPVPIVMISSALGSALMPTHFDAMAAGAVDVVEKPDFALLREHAGLRRKFRENLRAMSQVVTVTRRAGAAVRRSPPPQSNGAPATPQPLRGGRQVRDARLIVVGASTGGPPAIATALGRLDPVATPPVVLVQHMARGFIEGFVDWLDHKIPARVRLASDGDRLEHGKVFVAPDDRHVEVTPGGRLTVFDAPPLRYHRPSVDILFRSAATHYGASAVGVLLTGMGDDGARGLRAMRDGGAFTIAQDRESAAVWGMPGAAHKWDGVCWTGDCHAIAESLRGLRRESARVGGQS